MFGIGGSEILLILIVALLALGPEKQSTTISEVAPTIAGKTCDSMANVVLNAPLNGVATLGFTLDRLDRLLVAGSTSRTTPEPWKPAGQAVVVL